MRLLFISFSPANDRFLQPGKLYLGYIWKSSEQTVDASMRYMKDFENANQEIILVNGLVLHDDLKLKTRLSTNGSARLSFIAKFNKHFQLTTSFLVLKYPLRSSKMCRPTSNLISVRITHELVIAFNSRMNKSKNPPIQCCSPEFLEKSVLIRLVFIL